MMLDWANLDELLFVRKRSSISGEHFKTFETASIGAATRLLNWIQAAPTDSALQNAIKIFAHKAESINLGIKAVTLSDTGTWAQRVGFFPVTTRNGFDSQLWIDFRLTVVRLLQEHGCGQSLALALSKALHEMADNIVQHSQPEGTQHFVGLVGIEIDNGQFGFGVSDGGRGVLASLQENPANAHIQQERAAIFAAAVDHRSRRLEGGEGTGFKQLFRSLADLNGELLFSSGDARVTFSGVGTQKIVTTNSHMEQGFHLAVSCRFQS